MIILILTRLTELNRLTKRLIMVSFDSIIVVSVLIASFSFSENRFYWPNDELFWVFFGAPFLAIPIFFSFKLYQSVVRYIGFKALSSIAQAVTLYSVVWGLLSLLVDHPYMMILLGITSDPFASSFSSNTVYFEGISRSVIIFNWMLSLLAIGGSRLFARWIFNESNLNIINTKSNVLVFGADSAGRQLSQALQSSSDYLHIGYIDDTLANEKAYINNIPVFSFVKIEELIQKNNVNEIFLALPLISRKKRNEIIKKLSAFPIIVKSLPSISQLTEGKLKIDDLLEINTGELLGRESTNPNQKLLEVNIANKVVLVTGAGGSIGAELCRQIVLLKPKKLILFDISESSLYLIEQEILSTISSGTEIIVRMGSVMDKYSMKRIFSYYGVHTIYHAAAYKHVPLVEQNSSQGALNNVIGTMFAAQAAINANVKTFVLISTDKAVRPSSVMGATKRVAELVLQALTKNDHNTCLTMVRFGNVLDSSGSVIPLFKKQIKMGGPLTVTDVNVVRYFMTIPEASKLVIQAGAMSSGGDVFLLDMGKPIKIYDLAVKMIHLSGLQVLDDNYPDGDIEIKFTGLRPGEKLYEELIVGDDATKTENKAIMRANEKMIDWKTLEPMLDKLEKISKSGDDERVRKLLKEIVPEFDPKPNK